MGCKGSGHFSLGEFERMRGKINKVEQSTNDASAKSPRFDRGIPRGCSNPLCRLEFTPKRKDQRFCDPKCKEAFFRVKYALMTLAPYFNADLGEGPEVKGEPA